MSKVKVSDEALKNVFDGILNCFNEEQEPVNEILCPLIHKISLLNDDMDEAEKSGNIECLFTLRIKDAVAAIVNPNWKLAGLAKSLVTEYGFFDSHITALCERLYGSACCSDRSLYILRKAFKYCELGEIPEFKRGQYFQPETGTAEEWINYVRALIRLFYGKPDEYLLAFQALLTAK